MFPWLELLPPDGCNPRLSLQWSFFFFSWKSVKPYLLSLNNLSPTICTVISCTAFHHTAKNHSNKRKKRGNVSTTPHRPYKIYGSRRAFCPYFRTARDDDVIGIWSIGTAPCQAPRRARQLTLCCDTAGYIPCFCAAVTTLAVISSTVIQYPAVASRSPPLVPGSTPGKR